MRAAAQERKTNVMLHTIWDSTPLGDQKTGNHIVMLFKYTQIEGKGFFYWRKLHDFKKSKQNT